MAKKKDVGRFFYIHADLSGVPDVWKIGVTIAPYTAVRQRQKYMWHAFEIPHLFIGTGVDISKLETYLKNSLTLHGHGGRMSAQTELFNIKLDDLLEQITQTISRNSLKVFPVKLTEPYSAANSGECPLGLPSEPKVTRWVKDLLKNQLHITDPEDLATELWDGLFEIDGVSANDYRNGRLK